MMTRQTFFTTRHEVHEHFTVNQSSIHTRLVYHLATFVYEYMHDVHFCTIAISQMTAHIILLNPTFLFFIMHACCDVNDHAQRVEHDAFSCFIFLNLLHRVYVCHLINSTCHVSVRVYFTYLALYCLLTNQHLFYNY